MREHTVPCPHQHPVLPLSCTSSDVFPNQPGIGRITKWLSSYLVLRLCHRFRHTSQNDISSRVLSLCTIQINCSVDHLSTDSPNETQYRISPHSHPSCGSQLSMSCPLSDLSYSRSSAMRIQRPLRGSVLPSRLARASSAGRPLIRTRSSTCSSSRS